MIEPRNIKILSDAVVERRDNFMLEQVDDSCVRLAVNHDIYPWHSHPDSDECFIVLEGKLTVEFQDKPAVTLKPNDFFLVKAGVVHRTVPHGRTVNLCFEKANAETVFVE